MILKNVLIKAASLVGADVNFDESGDEQTLFTECGKDAILRVGAEFADVRTKQKAVSTGGMIPYSALNKSVKRVIKVVTADGKQPFTEESDGIKVGFDGEAEVTYAYFAEPIGLLSEIDLPPRFGLNMLALGVAGEYCYRKGFYKEGEIYDKRFAAALANATRDAKSVTLGAVEI